MLFFMGLNKLYFAASIYAEEHNILHSAHLVSQGEKGRSQIYPMESSVSCTNMTQEGEILTLLGKSFMLSAACSGCACYLRLFH